MTVQYIDFGFVKEQASFDAVLAHYEIEVTGSGDERRALCPFHDETNPSCSINLAKNQFHCFGCGTKGSILDFVAEIEDCDLRQAARVIGECCEIDLAPENRTNGSRRNKSRARSKEDGEEPAEHGNGRKRSQRTRAQDRAPSKAPRANKDDGSQKAPIEDEEAAENEPLTFALKLDREHPYADTRNIAPELVEHFEMGHCSRGMMKGRWCIPVHNVDGEIIAYAGRWAQQDDPPDGTKWLFPPKFKKSAVLFNLHRLTDVEHVVVVEGIFDAIRLHGLRMPVVALLGSSISDEQVALLVERGVERVTVMMDGDTVGHSATKTMVEALVGSLFVKAAYLSEDTDPSSIDEAELLALVEPVPV